MNSTLDSNDFGDLQLGRLASRNRRRAMTRLTLQYAFGLMMAVTMFFIVRNGLRIGMEAVIVGWPLFLLLAAGAAVLRRLNHAQHLELQRWSQHGLSVRENLDHQLTSIDDRRRGSRLLLTYAIVAQLAIMPSCWLLDQRGLLGDGQLPMIIGLCLLPSVVICLVHGYRLRVQLPRERAAVETMRRQLFGDD